MRVPPIPGVDGEPTTPEEYEEFEQHWDKMCAQLRAAREAAALQGRDYWADTFAEQLRPFLPPWEGVPDSDDELLAMLQSKTRALGYYVPDHTMEALARLEREALVARGARPALSRAESDALRARWRKQLERPESSEP